MITRVTRRDLRELLGAHWSGRLTGTEFLSRLYDLDELPSRDDRYPTMSGDIYQHTENNDDWPSDWIFDDSRLQLDDDEKLLRLLAETVHPEVVRDRREVADAVDAINALLSPDGFELFNADAMSGRPIFSWRSTAQRAPSLIPASADPATTTASQTDQPPEPKLPRLDVSYGVMLGAGAFGTVWQATDQLLERRMAVKFLTSTDEFLDENALIREARSLAKVTHPNLVTVYAAAWLRHPLTGLVAPAIMMELLVGNELDKWWGSQHDRHAVLRVASGLLAGVNAMHDAGLHHGDLHPQNVMVLTDGTAKLIDWRYQDTFIQRSTAHRRDLIEAEQRRAKDLVVSILEKQGLAEESMQVSRTADFSLVQATIANLQNSQWTHGSA